MPPLTDSPIRYLPSQIATAASRILAAYLTHNRVSAIEAARLAVRVEAVLAELVAGSAGEAAPPPAEVEPAPRRARRATPAKTPRVTRPRRPEAQAVLDLVQETETDSDSDSGVSETELPVAAAEPVPLVEERQEIDLLTGGPLPPATESDYPVLPQMPVRAESPGTPGKKRKRPPRPASQRRAARVAAIEQMLVEGEEPPEGEAEG